MIMSVRGDDSFCFWLFAYRHAPTFYVYIVALLSILGAQAIAVPLSPGFPASELRYVVKDSSALMLLSSATLGDKATEVCAEGLDQCSLALTLEESSAHSAVSDNSMPILAESFSGDAGGGMMLYTSGTTSRPVRVVIIAENDG